MPTLGTSKVPLGVGSAQGRSLGAPATAVGAPLEPAEAVALLPAIAKAPPIELEAPAVFRTPPAELAGPPPLALPALATPAESSTLPHAKVPHAIAAAPKNFRPNRARTLETGAACTTALRKFGRPKKVAAIRRKFEARAF